jgi:SAM-dependent methyltransferase
MKKQIYNVIAKGGIKFLSKVFPEYFQTEPLEPSDRYIEYHFAISNMPMLPAKVLDVGCSGTFFPLLLSAFGYDTIGIDIRPYPILNALSFPKFRFYQTDLSFVNTIDKFDYITLISTLEHFGIGGRYGQKENLRADRVAMDKVAELLKPDGYVILTIPYGKYAINRPFNKVYDAYSLFLTTGYHFDIITEQYYIKRKDWERCGEWELAGKEGLACLKLGLRKRRSY